MGVATNRILHGDCTEVLATPPSASVNFILTDPLYGVRYKDRTGCTIANDDSLANVIRAFPDLYRVLKDDSLCIFIYGWNRIDDLFDAWTNAGFRPIGHIVRHMRYASSRRFLHAHHEQAYVLAKGKPAKPRRSIENVQPWKYTGNKAHSTEKAICILKSLIKCFLRPDALVLDPFCGSASTCVAAALTRRRYLGIELDANYCRLTEKRLAGAARFLEEPANDSVSSGFRRPNVLLDV
jgi:adenine-specific DNA-methyltransferase